MLFFLRDSLLGLQVFFVELLSNRATVNNFGCSMCCLTLHAQRQVSLASPRALCCPARFSLDFRVVSAWSAWPPCDPAGPRPVQGGVRAAINRWLPGPVAASHQAGPARAPRPLALPGDAARLCETTGDARDQRETSGDCASTRSHRLCPHCALWSVED